MVHAAVEQVQCQLPAMCIAARSTTLIIDDAKSAKEPMAIRARTNATWVSLRSSWWSNWVQLEESHRETCLAQVQGIQDCKLKQRTSTQKQDRTANVDNMSGMYFTLVTVAYDLEVLFIGSKMHAYMIIPMIFHIVNSTHRSIIIFNNNFHSPSE